MRVYLAGPMSGKPNFNYPAFHAGASYLHSYGYDVMNPAESFDMRVDLPYAWYLREAIRLVTISEELYLLDGWHMSKGALVELHIALALGLPVYYLTAKGAIYQSRLTLADLPELLQMKENLLRVSRGTEWQNEGWQDDPSEPFIIEVGYPAGCAGTTTQGDSLAAGIGG